MNLNDLRKIKWEAKLLTNRITIKGTALAESLKNVAHAISVLEHLASWHENVLIHSDDKSDIWEEIKKERAYQDHKWGGADHDDKHHMREWLIYIGSKTTKALIASSFDKKLWRKCMIQIAALSVAAIESYDRINYDK